MSYGAHDDFWPEGPFRYRRHEPEKTLLYQLVDQHWPAFQAMLEAQGKRLPGYVVREFEDYLKCGRLEHGARSTVPPISSTRSCLNGPFGSGC